MIGLNKNLEERAATGRPVRIGVIGAGQMGTDVDPEASMMKYIQVDIAIDMQNSAEIIWVNLHKGRHKSGYSLWDGI